MHFNEIHRFINEGLLGRDVRNSVSLDDLRKPTQNTAVHVYVSALQNLSIPFENATVAPYTDNDPVMMEALFRDENFYFNYLVSRMNLLLKKCRIELKGDPKHFHLGDIINPQKDRYNEILSHLIKITQFFNISRDKITDIITDFEDHKRQTEKDKKEVDKIEKQTDEIESQRQEREAEMKSLQTEIEEKTTQKDTLTYQYHEISEELKKVQDDSLLLRSNVANLSQEIQNFSSEKKTLQELEVTDPEHWERVFVEKSESIERGKAENAQLSADIPRTHKEHSDHLSISEQLKIMSKALSDYVKKVETKEECEASFVLEKRRRQELNQKRENLRSDMKAQTSKCEKMHRKIVQNLEVARKTSKDLQLRHDKTTETHYEQLSIKENLENLIAEYSLEYEETKEFNIKSKSANDEFMSELKLYADELNVVFQEIHKSRLNVMKKTFIS